MAILDDVKLMLDMSETDVDKRLELIIQNAQNQLIAYLPDQVELVPAALQYIVCELAVARFNRLGNEGMASYSQEGESITYGEDISSYLPAIQAWIKNQEGCSGVVRFL